MPGGGQNLVTGLIGPGLVAALVSFLLSLRTERTRAERDYTTKLSDAAKDDVRKAIEAGVDYFSCGDSTKLLSLEAKVMLLEAEVRSSYNALRESCSLKSNDAWCDAEDALSSFLSYLTGAHFGSVEAGINRDQCRLIAGAGTALRLEMTRIRRQQIRQSYRERLARLLGLSSIKPVKFFGISIMLVILTVIIAALIWYVVLLT